MFFSPLITLLVLGGGSLALGEVTTTPWIEHAPGQVENWMHRHELLLNQTRLHGSTAKAVFLGDSITYRWSKLGHPVWVEHYQNRGALNYGIGGDRTENILWRLSHGEMEKVQPKVVVLMIGTNNVSHKDNATNIVKGVKAILDSLHSKMPKAKVLLMSVLPRANVKYDTEIHQLNGLLSSLANQSTVFWFDLGVHFESSLAHVKAELYESDQIHLSLKGYTLWQQKMEPIFSKLIQ